MIEFAEHRLVARFRLYVRCHGCRLKVSTVVGVPGAEGAPTTVDELLESEFLTRQPFRCPKCESPIASLIGVTTLEIECQA